MTPDAVPTIFNFNPTQRHNQQVRKARTQKRTKRWQDLLHQVVRRKTFFPLSVQYNGQEKETDKSTLYI